MAIGKITSKALAATAAMPPSGGTFTGDVIFQGNINGAYSLPTSDGTANQVLTTDGSGTITFADAGGGADLYAANESSPSAQPSATGANAIAIGDSAVSSSADGIAIGLGATHTTVHGTSNALAIGANTVADYYGTAIGAGTPSDKTTASGNSSLAIGYTAKSTGTLATAIGKSRAGNTNSFAANIDNNSTTYGGIGANSIVMGKQARANSSNGIAIGTNAYSNFGAVVIGYNSYTSANSGVAIGYDVHCGYQALTLGFGCSANGNTSIAIGRSANAGHTNSASFGKSVSSTAANQVNIGGSTQDVRISETYTLPKVDGSANQTLTTDGSGVISWATPGGGADLYAANESSPAAQPSATGANAIAIGDSAVSTGTDSFALGKARATGDRSIAIHTGTNATYGATTGDCIAIGEFAKATTSMAVAIGRSASATGNQSLGLGFVATATGENATSIQRGLASGNHSFAAHITNSTTSYGASGANSIAMGYLAKATAGNTVAIGPRAIASSTSSMSFCTSYANYGNVSSAANAITMGDGNAASATSAIATGYGANSAVQGKHAHANGSFGDGNAEGSAQRGTFVLRCDTTDATAEALRTNTGAAATNNQITLPNNSCYGFTGTVIAREAASATNDFAVWEIKGGAVRAASASTTALGTYNINKISESTGATNWSIALSADTTNGAVAITVTGEASHNIRWVATVNTTEVTY